MDNNNNQSQNQHGISESGNASNPSPSSGAQPQKEQLINPRGEKYLREVSSIEDLPDARDEQEAEKDIKEANDEA